MDQLVGSDKIVIVEQRHCLGVSDQVIISPSDEVALREPKTIDKNDSIPKSKNKFEDAVIGHALRCLECRWSHAEGGFQLANNLISGQDMNPFLEELLARLPPKRPKEKSRKLVAVLKGVSNTGEFHIRPLCTEADLVLAMHELLDSKLYRLGGVHLGTIHVPGVKMDKQGTAFYTAEYVLNGERTYHRLSVKETVPVTIHPFLCPLAMPNAFNKSVIDGSDVPLLDKAFASAIDIFQSNLCDRSHMLVRASCQYQHGLSEADGSHHFRLLHVLRVDVVETLTAYKRGMLVQLEARESNWIKSRSQVLEQKEDFASPEAMRKALMDEILVKRRRPASEHGLLKSIEQDRKLVRQIRLRRAAMKKRFVQEEKDSDDESEREGDDDEKTAPLLEAQLMNGQSANDPPEQGGINDENLENVTTTATAEGEGDGTDAASAMGMTALVRTMDAHMWYLERGAAGLRPMQEPKQDLSSPRPSPRSPRKIITLMRGYLSAFAEDITNQGRLSSPRATSPKKEVQGRYSSFVGMELSERNMARLAELKRQNDRPRLARFRDEMLKRPGTLQSRHSTQLEREMSEKERRDEDSRKVADFAARLSLTEALHLTSRGDMGTVKEQIARPVPPPPTSKTSLGHGKLRQRLGMGMAMMAAQGKMKSGMASDEENAGLSNTRREQQAQERAEMEMMQKRIRESEEAEAKKKEDELVHEHESHEVLEILLSYVPSKVAHKVRAGVKRAYVKLHRPEELVKEKKKKGKKGKKKKSKKSKKATKTSTEGTGEEENLQGEPETLEDDWHDDDGGEKVDIVHVEWGDFGVSMPHVHAFVANEGATLSDEDVRTMHARLQQKSVGESASGEDYRIRALVVIEDIILARHTGEGDARDPDRARADTQAGTDSEGDEDGDEEEEEEEEEGDGRPEDEDHGIVVEAPPLELPSSPQHVAQLKPSIAAQAGRDEIRRKSQRGGPIAFSDLGDTREHPILEEVDDDDDDDDVLSLGKLEDLDRDDVLMLGSNVDTESRSALSEDPSLTLSEMDRSEVSTLVSDVSSSALSTVSVKRPAKQRPSYRPRLTGVRTHIDPTGIFMAGHAMQQPPRKEPQGSSSSSSSSKPQIGRGRQTGSKVRMTPASAVADMNENWTMRIAPLRAGTDDGDGDGDGDGCDHRRAHGVVYGGLVEGKDALSRNLWVADITDVTPSGSGGGGRSRAYPAATPPATGATTSATPISAAPSRGRSISPRGGRHAKMDDAHPNEGLTVKVPPKKDVRHHCVPAGEPAGHLAYGHGSSASAHIPDPPPGALSVVTTTEQQQEQLTPGPASSSTGYHGSSSPTSTAEVSVPFSSLLRFFSATYHS